MHFINKLIMITCVKVASMVLVGDAKGKIAILIDDMADTCGTIVQVCPFLQHFILSLKLEDGVVNCIGIPCH